MTSSAANKARAAWQSIGQQMRHLLFGPNTAWIVLALSACATLWAWYATHEAAQEKMRLLFEFRAQETQNIILKRLQDHEHVLHGAAGLFAASEHVDRKEWQAYIASLEIHAHYPGIQGIGFAPWVTAENKTEHVLDTRKNDFHDYAIRPAGNRGHYTPIMYLEPLGDSNLRAIGYDMFFEPALRQAMERARDSDTPALSGKTPLTQEAGTQTQARTLLFLPVYKNGMPHSTIAERRAALTGFIYSQFRMNNLLDGILGHAKADARTDIDVGIFDGTQSSPETLLYDDDAILHATDARHTPLFTYMTTITTQGRVWTLHFSTRPPFESNISTQKPLMVLIIGLFVSGLIFGLITVRRKAEENLRRFNDVLEQRIQERTHQLEAANKELESFSYSVAHDLQAPLRALSGFSQILTENHADTLDADASNYLNRIHLAGERMSQLIEDLLTLSRTARTALKIETFNLSDLVEEIQINLRQRESTRAISITTRADLMAQGDRRLLEIALENLLMNAWKFTLKNPYPSIEFGALEQAGETIYFVRDNGAGFDMKQINKLFKPFERLNPSSTFAGTGIGLSIVSRVIERHGGRIWAEGAEDKGATFYFTLPENR